MVNNVKIDKGEYTLMLDLKDASNWEWVINKDSKGRGVFSYQKSDDIVRVKAKITKGLRNRERLNYYITPDTDKQGTIYLRWEKAEASFLITTNTDREALVAVKQYTNQLKYYNLGEAAMQIINVSNKKKDLEMAEKLVKSAYIMGGKTMRSVWWHALVMAKMNKRAEANQLAAQLKEMYAKEKRAGWRSYYEGLIKPNLSKDMKEWKLLF